VQVRMGMLIWGVLVDADQGKAGLVAHDMD
jgi:hypothetical protein